MSQMVNRSKLRVSKILAEFLELDVMRELNLDIEKFWNDFEKIINDFAPRNLNLLKKRQKLKTKIDKYYSENKDKKVNITEYINFLKNIGYIIPEGPDFLINTSNVDDEIAKIPGPQLVVPITNARYSINAANARWGSLYDALYGTDIISEDDGSEKMVGYNPKRGKKVISFAKDFLDKCFPLKKSNHKNVTEYSIINENLVIKLDNNEFTELSEEQKFIGYNFIDSDKQQILLKNLRIR